MTQNNLTQTKIQCETKLLKLTGNYCTYLLLNCDFNAQKNSHYRDIITMTQNNNLNSDIEMGVV